jgi:hypothetical protein
MKKFILTLVAALLVISSMAQQWNPKLTEKWEPVPKLVTPGDMTSPPSDAIILFDGTNLDQWTNPDGDSAQWEIGDGFMTIIPRTGGIMTKQSFGDVQLHIEWMTPVGDTNSGQGRGNSGIFLQSLYEVQVLDSYENVTYSNGQAASVYKQIIPLVNACRPPGEWQTYEIIYTAPRFNSDSTLFSAPTLTVIQNGILVQNHVTLRGPTTYTGLPEHVYHDAKLPLMLQNHTDRVSYRNIWVREL